MELQTVLVIACLAVVSHAYPQAQSYSSFSTGPISSQGEGISLGSSGISLGSSGISLGSSHAVYSAPVLVHKPVIVAHKPVLHHAPEVEHYAPPHYEFKYGVKDQHTHDIKEQAEKRVGDKVEGYYTLLEPDGTTRTVKYTADHETGFHAIVTKSGHAVHPTHIHKAIHKVALPVHKVVSSPLISYSAPAPLVSLSAAPVASSGGATSFSSFSL